MIAKAKVLIVGGGEMGSAVAHRLRRAGFEVWIVEVDKPTCIRRLVCYASACHEGAVEVEGVRASKVGSVDEAIGVAAKGEIPVITGEFKDLAQRIKPDVLIDARMLKKRSDVSRNMAPLVIGLGPGFIAGGNVDVVIETNRGHNLGRVIYEGEPEGHTGEPAPVMGFTHQRVVRAPVSGIFKPAVRIGDMVDVDDVIGFIDEVHEVRAPIAGLVRGLAAQGLPVHRNQKIGDIDPRGDSISADTISDKGRAVAGGVLEAVVRWYWHDRQED